MELEREESNDDTGLETIDAVLALAEELGRDDLVQRLRIARARVTRPTCIVCVVGEFKQGKSSLVNALIGNHVCPVDDDLATSAVTLVRHGDEVAALVRRKDGDHSVVETVDIGDVRDWVTETGNPSNERNVERVEISVPAPVLARGLVLVDTPGMGGLGAGHAATTLAFLPFADGLILATDASTELTAPEAELLQQATDRCPTVLVAMTKTDLHAHWHRIADLDRGHLDRLGADALLLPVSAALRFVAADRDDAELEGLSGFPGLLDAVSERIERPAKQLAAERALADCAGALIQLEGAMRAELSALSAPEVATPPEAFERAQQRLEHLRGPGARWNVLVADRIADLSNDLTFRLRGALRSVTRDIEDEIEELKTPKQWEELSRRLQTEVAEAVADAFADVQRGSDAIREAVVEVLAEETLELPPLEQRQGTTDPRALWVARRIDPKSARVTSTITGLRGAQSGILMFGMMSRFLPSGAAAFLALSPVTLGIGAAFAGVQLVDAHKRKVQQRRAAARTNLRLFIDDVHFEVGNELGDAFRAVQRSIRDEFSERMAELQRTYADVARRAQEARNADGSRAAERIARLHDLLARVDTLRGRVTAGGR